MSFEKFKELGYDITEKEFLRNQARINREYQKAYRQIKADLEAQYAKLASTGVDKANFYNEMLKLEETQVLLKER